MRFELALLLAPCLLFFDLLLNTCQLCLQLLPGVRVFCALHRQPGLSNHILLNYSKQIQLQL